MSRRLQTFAILAWKAPLSARGKERQETVPFYQTSLRETLFPVEDVAELLEPSFSFSASFWHFFSRGFF